MSIYVILSSDKSKDYFPNNKPYQFKSRLNAPLLLEGMWKVALVEADISCSMSKEESICLFSNICSESIIEGEKHPLLRKLSCTQPGDWTSILENPHYMLVNGKELYDISIYITDRHGQYASFLDQPSTITLHFKSFPFF